MAFLKKSLFLVLFLGLVSLSICEEEKKEEEEKEEEENAESKEKRFLPLILPSIVTALSSFLKQG
uniref:Dermal antimicrobial peptide n=1 Tax=Boana semilineata TaxID=2339192 RepID=T2D330_9NEOB|nr:dermal antimicrobial peptide precursor [Boana semilineata]